MKKRIFLSILIILTLILSFSIVNLLNINYIKQENGQFFTPVPIARFINYCIQYENIIEAKINKREANCLPKVIDYACGSGHFLTEAMDRIQKQIDIEAEKNHNSNIQNNLDDWKTKTNWQAYRWTKDFIFGIENNKITEITPK